MPWYSWSERERGLGFRSPGVSTENVRGFTTDIRLACSACPLTTPRGWTTALKPMLVMGHPLIRGRATDPSIWRGERGRYLREERSVLAETQVVAPRVDHVEGALAPRAFHDLAGWLAVHIVRREQIELSGPLMDCIDVVDRERQRLRSRCRYQPALRDVDDGDDDAAAVEVVAGTGMARAVGGEELPVQLGGGLEVAHFECDAEQLRYCGHDMRPFFSDRGPGDRQISPPAGGSSS